ncbi:MAG: uroporphyrinogen-III synthase [Flavobacteriales bacterium]|nr:uroporphyrinogen-III synthase [Flavobacteriales bacterium]
MKVKSILVSQPKPETDKSPYFDLAQKFKVKIDFKPFIHLEGVPAKDFRKEKITLQEYSAIIFTSRNSVDHFFRIAEEMRYIVPETLKYFCISESTAFYLQKYVVYRKRKIFYGKQTFNELMDIIKKHKDEYFLLPCSDIHKQDISKQLKDSNIKFEKAILYRTVCSDLKDLKNVNYDILVFFSPSGITSLFQNFPNFKQRETKVAVFGHTTAKAAMKAGLKIDISAPNTEAPSMTMALEQFIKRESKKK